MPVKKSCKLLTNLAIYITFLKKNLVFDDTEGKEDYLSVESLIWTRLGTKVRENY
jgi:hypothetical protein